MRLLSLTADTVTDTATFWEQAVEGVTWFFTNLAPASVFVPIALAVCVAFFVYYWHCLKPRPHTLEWIAMSEERIKPRRMSLTLKRHPFERQDVIPVLLITAVYAFTAFFQLGDTAVPQSHTVFQKGDSYTFSYSEPVTVDKFSCYTSIGIGNYAFEYQDENGNWHSIKVEQKYNSTFKWLVTDLLTSEKEGEEPHGAVTATSFRLRATSVKRSEGLWLNELALWSDGQPLIPDQVSPGGEALFDESELWADKQTYMNSAYFDEIFHPRTSYEHLVNAEPYEITHPPLGKLIIAAGIELFGMTPFGWRFSGTLFGVLMVPILYLFLKNFFGKTAVAFCGTCLFTFDFMHLTQTRLSTIDTYGVFFVLVSYYFMYRWLAVPAGTKLRKSVLPLFLSGLFWGIGAASKWTVIYGGVGLALMWLLGLIWKGREWPAALGQQSRPRFAPYLVGTFFLSIVFFVVIPACIYTASYIPYLTAEAALEGTPLDLPNLLRVMWDNQVYMLTYHQGATSSHPYSSEWYMWLVDGRPILYYRDLTLVESQGIKSLFAAFNNPLVSWTGLMAFVAVIIQTVRRKCGKGLFILISTLSQFVPWLFIGRTVFAYHYFPTVLFLVFAISYLMDDMLTRRRRGFRLAVYGFTGCTVALYAMFYPVLIGLYTPTWYNWNFLRWLPSWPL